MARVNLLTEQQRYFNILRPIAVPIPLFETWFWSADGNWMDTQNPDFSRSRNPKALSTGSIRVTTLPIPTTATRPLEHPADGNFERRSAQFCHTA
jgi:hypothetical protein